MLQHENKSGGRTTYALQAPTARAAHDWYMALYQCIPYAQLDPFFFPDTRCTKPLWPKFIDIRVPWLHPAIIRLPLDTLDDALNGNENDALASPSSSSSIVTISAQDLKRCLYAMLNDMADADDHLHQPHHHHHHEHHEHHRQRRTPAARQRSQWLHLQNPEAALAMRRLALCWHHRGNAHESSSQTGAQGRMEWINDDASILGPQCINKEHTLELHDLDKEMATDLPPDLPTMPRPLEDFLLQSTEDGQFKKARQQQRVYAVLEGHFLFLMEPGKAKLPANASPSVSTDARARTWFAHAASSIPQLSKKFLTKASLTHANMFRRHHRHDHDTGDGHDARGRPQSWLSYASSTHWEREHLQELMRRGEHIAHAFAVIDLTLVSHVAPVRTTTTASASLANDPSTASTPTSPSQQDQQHPSRLTSPEGSAANLLDEHAKRRKRLFQLVYAGNAADTIQFEASSAQAMFEWLRRLRKAIAYAHAARDYGIVQTQAKASLWYRRMDHPILQSGLLFARLDGQKTYRRYLCVLVRGHGLFLHRYCGGGAMMQRYRYISLNNDKATYAFGADRPSDVQAPRHQQTRSAQQPHEPELAHVFTLAGAVTRPQLHECAFILWQRYSFSRNHVVMLVREHLSHLKLGHRLGRKGATFSFLADSQNDKEAWLWAIQHEMDQYCYT
ncbi:hypothetical protein BC940DRAFT_294133 [Gongronella butleri]|nr:hypothetical protein BC940DRAFT_294133 [Gongronella butleri]